MGVICAYSELPVVFEKVDYDDMERMCFTLNMAILHLNGLPRWPRGKESACHVGDLGLIAGSRKFPREGNGNPLQYPHPGNPTEQIPWDHKRVGSNLATEQEHHPSIS